MRAEKDGDCYFFQGVIKGMTPRAGKTPDRVTFEVSEEDAKQLREWIRPIYADTDEQYIPAWIKSNKSKRILATSNQDIFITIEEKNEMFDNVADLMEYHGIVDDSTVIATIEPRKYRDGRVTIILRDIAFIDLVELHLERFFDPEFENLEVN